MPLPDYLQDMSPEEIPRGTFHVARWHCNGKLWIARGTGGFVWVSKHRDAVEASVEILCSQGRGSGQSPYFVWSAEMSEAEIMAQKLSNKIE